MTRRWKNIVCVRMFDSSGRFCMRQLMFVVLAVVSCNQSIAFERGDQLVVARPTEMKTITGSTHEITAGTPVTVRSTEDGKLKVAAPRVGWIDASAVIPSKDAEAYFS